MKEAIDWEDLMKATERSARSASRNSENAVAGMVKLLDRSDRHSSKMSELETAIKELSLINLSDGAKREVGTRVEEPSKDSSRLAIGGVLLTFAAGFICGAFIGS